MARRCSTILPRRRLATAFFGGMDRGKVVQIHLEPRDLEAFLGVTVFDHDSELVSTFEEWLKVECQNADMVIFDRDAAEKVSTVPIVQI